MAFFKEFREFALKGNVMDMAVGVIIGGAFGKIISSLVNDILMPPIGALIGNTDFSKLRLDISKVRDVVVAAETKATEAAATVANTVADTATTVADSVVEVVASPAAAATTEAASTNAVVLTDLVAQVAPNAEPIYWNYGMFIQQCVDFTILALCVFMMVKLMNKLMHKHKEEPAPAAEPAPSKEEVLLAEIRDLLREQKK